MKQITLVFSFFLFIFSTNAQDCLPTSSPWTSVDIGAVALAGSSCYDASQNTFEVTASGADIWGSSDEFHYVHQELNGDGEIIARVDGLTNTHPWAKAGVMMRNSTNADAAQILMSLSTNPVNVGIGYSLQDRPSKGAIMRDDRNNIGPVPVGAFPYYVRLVREGNNFSGYTSPTNGNWTLVGMKTIPMDETILVGLATTSHRDGTATMATYSEVEIEEASITDMAPFITTWKTDNPGTSADNQITISTNDGAFTPYSYDYNYTVHWGDGSSDIGVLGDITHTYATAGTYTVSITGDFPRIYFEPDFRGNYDSGKLLSIEQWGDIEWLSMEFAFYTCQNLDVKATDLPNLSNVQSMAGMFQGCISLIGNPSFNEWDVSNVTDMNSMFNETPNFNQDIGNWEVGNVQHLDRMFELASSFNQDIGNWDVGSAKYMYAMFFEASAFDQDLGSWNVTEVINMSGMFGDAGLSTENYDSLLMGWSAQPLQSGIVFSGGNSQYCLGEEARQTLVDEFGWTITDGGKSADCEAPQRSFITTWKTDNQGSSADNQITIPTFPGETYNYSVDWGDGSSITGLTGDATHFYAIPGIYTVSISGVFPRILFDQGKDQFKIQSIEQWGDIQWSSMDSAFQGCLNLEVNATDSPDLSNVTSLRWMFSACRKMTGTNSFSNWDVANIVDMGRMFIACNLFNQDLSSWNVSQVTDMNSMFQEADAFNQDIGNWNVSNVTDMRNMFSLADNFNQDLSEWDVSNVTNMRGMFAGTPFNQNIGNWDVSNVENFESIFVYAPFFNQDISGWDVGKATNMNRMFESAIAFNQDIGNWDVSNVTSMKTMFKDAGSFDQNLGNWNVIALTNATDIFEGAGISTVNYDQLLQSWSELPNLKNGVPFDGGNRQYCLGEDARQKLIDDYGWVITDGGKRADCEEPQRPFITTWKTDNEGSSADNQIMIPTFPGETYNYTVDWGDGTYDSGVAGDISHFYTSAGTYQLRIIGNYPRIAFGNSGDSDKLVSVDQWGDTQWTSMADAFSNCSNMQVLAMDTPNLSNVTSFHDMFRNADSMNTDISGWDTSNITTMSYMFYDADSFNQDISGWDTSNVTGMYFMFYIADKFNQDLSNWDVSSVTNMSLMFSGSDLSSSNYDSMLVSWSEQEGLNSSVPFGAHGISYCEGAVARQKLIDTYNWDISDDGLECVNSIPFITTWKTDNPGTSEDNQIIISTNDGVLTPYNYDYNYTVHWGDGSSDTGVSGDIIHTYATAGTYTVSITGDFPRIYFGEDFRGDYDSGKLLSVEQWGDIQWLSMEFAFHSCENLDVKATDLPNLSNVQNMAGMFQGCSSLIGNPSFNKWDVSNVTDMNSMFYGATTFNQDIGNWDVINVTDMNSMFYRATDFNRDISNWEVRNVQSLGRMFQIASSFNQNIGNWDVSNTKYMTGMFFEASAFDQDLGSWNVTGVINMRSMFGDAGLSTENYDSLLMGWSALPLQSGIVFSGGNSQYCQSEEARQKLVDDFGWTINDGGLSDECAKRCVALPSPWTGTDIGAVAAAGTSCYNAAQDTFEITASGADIWGTNDEFHYVYQELTGDGEIIARVDGLTNTHPWAKAGVMMRNSTASDAAQILMSLSPNPVNVGIGYSLQDRPSDGAAMRSDANNIGPVGIGSFPYYVRLVREGNNFTGYASATNGNWTLVGNKAITMNETILVGLATTSHRDGTLAKANYSEVSIKSNADPVENNPPEIFLEGDEFVFLFNGEPYIELGAKAIDIEDGDISNSILISSTVDSTRAGIYVVYYFVSDFDGASATEIRTVLVEERPDFTPPLITLIGPDIITLVFGETYEEFGATAIDDVDGDLTQDIIIDTSGLDISNLGTSNVIYSVSDAAGNEALARVRRVDVVPESPCLPFPWRNTDIGDVAVNGTACVRTPGNSFEVTASGADIWGSSDEFHYVYQRLTGDGEIIARVDGLTNTHPWAKAGVMMRNSIDSDAAQILMSLSPNPVNVGIGYSLQDRPSKGATMNSVANNIGPVAVGNFPYYVRLVREGNKFTGYASPTQGNWTLVGTKTIAMEATILVGLATTSHRDGAITTANYAEVELRGATSAAKVAGSLAEVNSQNRPKNTSNATILSQSVLEMRTFPNPTSETVNVSFGTILTITEFKIYDVTGRLVSTQKADASKIGSDYQLSVKPFRTGAYFLRAYDDVGGVYQKQLLIKR